MNKFVLPIAIAADKLKLYVNWLGTILIAWVFAGICSTAVASFIPTSDAVAPLASKSPSLGGSGQFSRSMSRQQYDVVVERNLFDSKNRIADKKDAHKERKPIQTLVNNDGPPVKTSLPLTLLGTLVSSQPQFSLATISASRGATEQFGIGDKILKKAEVTSIERNRVYFIHNGRKEYLEASESGVKGLPARAAVASPRGKSADGVKEVSPGKFNVDRGRVESVVANLSEVMTQARVVPHFENGKSAGWKIFAIKPNSIYSELSLKNGDIIQRINGTDIDSPAKALEMYQQLAAESNISIDLVRRGKKQTFEYDIN